MNILPPADRGGEQHTPSETAKAATARVYTAAGWSAFPCWWIAPPGTCACPQGRRCTSPGKHPIHMAAPHGVKDASRDEAVIAAWWKRFPDANIGIPAGDNGLAILDVDTDKGGAASLDRLMKYMHSQGQPIPSTVTARTGSGGLHILFAAPDGGIKSGANVFGPDMLGLDTRGRGGYVIAAPSNHHSGGVYEWIHWGVDLAPWPAILTDLMAPKPPPRPATPSPAQGVPAQRSGSVDRWAAKALAAELADVRSAREPGRNDALNTAAFNVGQIVAGGHLDRTTAAHELLTAALSCGLTDFESKRTILSGFRASAGKPRHPRSVR